MAIAGAAQKELRGLVVPKCERRRGGGRRGDRGDRRLESGRRPSPFSPAQIDIEPTPPRVDEWFQQFADYDVDFADVRGQEMAKRAIDDRRGGRP